MDKAKKKFKLKKEIYTSKKKDTGLTTVDADSKKNRENELLTDDAQNEAVANSDLFEPVTTDSDVDYTDGGTVT